MEQAPSQRRLGPVARRDPAHASVDELPQQGPLHALPGQPADGEGLAFYLQPAVGEEQVTHTYRSKHSQVNLDKFNADEIQCLACVAQLSEGISIPNLWVSIIWHAFGDERKAVQRIGRLLRLNPKQTATMHLLTYQNTVDEQ